MSKQKLELTWIGKEKRPKLEPRILLEDPEKSYHASQRVSEEDLFDNKLIFGDNLLALKALEQDYNDKIKCIFIDPPYNTKNAFKHYDDGLEHSIWLGMMRERLVLLRNLLSKDGSLWITIDDKECHYLKVLCDEVFGRENFLANALWEKVYSERMDSTGFSTAHDHILVYQKTENFSINQFPKDQNTKQFNFVDSENNKQYRRRSLRKEGSSSLRSDRPSMWYEITAPDGSHILPIKPDGIEGRWRWKKENVDLRREELEFVEKDGRWEVYVKQYLDSAATRPPSTWFSNDTAGHNHEAKLEAKSFNSTDVFDTPKPERLLREIIFLATKKGDLVLDSFAGSGTTGAVAHKMGRKWIMVELEETAHTHIIPRLKKVIDGKDLGGVTFSQSETPKVTLCKTCKDGLCEKCSEKIKTKTKPIQQWFGGGGFRYYKLAPSLLKKDQWDNWVINKEYNPEMLSEALCKLQGFNYAPSDTEWWQHGHSTESDFIYVTTQTLSIDYIAKISAEVGENRSLLICCSAFKGNKDAFPNLTLKKIPQTVLNQCEWDNDDYSLNVENLPQMKAEPEQGDLF